MNRALIDTDVLSYYFKGDPLIIALTEESCKISAEIYSKLRFSGELIDDIDLLIAGIAIENEMTLVTNNENHFGRISGLKIEIGKCRS